MVVLSLNSVLLKMSYLLLFYVHRCLDCIHVYLCITICKADIHRGPMSLDVPRTEDRRVVSQCVESRNQGNALTC